MSELRLSPVEVVVLPGVELRGPHEVDRDKVERYALELAAGTTFPPVRLVDYRDGTLMIVDGHHRAAAQRVALVPLAALVVDGEAFEDLDCRLRDEGEGRRADDAEFWQ